VDGFLANPPLWSVMVLLLFTLPAIAIGLQAIIRRRFPDLKQRKHNDVAGFLVAVIGVIYAVTVGFIIASQWDNYTEARDHTYQEAFTLASIAEGSVVMGPQVQQQISAQIVAYNKAVIAWWPRSGRPATEFDPPEDASLIHMLETVNGLNPTTEAQRAFVREATADLIDVEAQSDQRTHQAGRAHLEFPLWLVIGIASGVTTAFCLLFGLETEWLHYVMVGAVALIIGSNLLLVVLLDHPLSGVMPVSPDAYQAVVDDLGA
jgi:Protein of unknown function (DUF4239)